MIILRRTIFLISMPLFILGLILPIYGKEIGASVVEIGLFFSVFSLMSVLLRPLVGWGLDHYGRRGFYLAGLGGYALTMISFAFIDQTVGIILARALQGISASLVWLSASAITADLAGEQERGSVFGGVTQANSRGAIAGTFIGYFLLSTDISLRVKGIELNNWTLLFLIYGIFGAYALFIGLRGLPETRPVISETVSSPICWTRTWNLLLLVTLVTGASSAMISPILIIFLQDKLRLGVDVIAWAYLPAALVYALLPARLGKLSDRFGSKPLMIIALVAAAATSFVIPYLGSVIALVAVWAFQATCYAAGDPAEQALVAHLTGKDHRGRAYGFYVMFAGIGATIGPLGGAWLYQTYNPGVPFMLNGVILALCAVLLIIFLKVPENSERILIKGDGVSPGSS